MKYNKVIIGIDQSYSNTGISLAADGCIKKIRNIPLDKLCKSNSDKRRLLSEELGRLLSCVANVAEERICIIERIRLSSKGFLNIDYIKSIGALNAVIVDACALANVKVYSVDTRCWKAQVVGTSKPQPNKYGVPDEKWPTVRWCIKKGFEDSILHEVVGRKQKGTFVKDGIKYMYDNDAADSAGIAMFGFIGDKTKLQEER